MAVTITCVHVHSLRQLNFQRQDAVQKQPTPGSLSYFPDSQTWNSLVSISVIFIHEKGREVSSMVYSDSEHACLAPSLPLQVKMASEVNQSAGKTGTGLKGELSAAFCPPSPSNLTM